mgnify:CR=1 FL=1
MNIDNKNLKEYNLENIFINYLNNTKLKSFTIILLNCYLIHYNLKGGVIYNKISSKKFTKFISYLTSIGFNYEYINNDILITNKFINYNKDNLGEFLGYQQNYKIYDLKNIKNCLSIIASKSKFPPNTDIINFNLSQGYSRLGKILSYKNRYVELWTEKFDKLSFSNIISIINKFNNCLNNINYNIYIVISSNEIKKCIVLSTININDFYGEYVDMGFGF